ncbi:hypothetical protein [Archangium sp.]|jgi:hypothetical protein|uniref:hypothetical protein n=1 Tax=Archangium sp. TaxID=1872627 RepID=UPI002ED79C43
MKRLPRAALLVRALALLDLALVSALGGLLLHDFLRYGTAWVNKGESGALVNWIVLAGILTLPALLLAWLAVGLWRFDRAAWVLRVGLGLLTVPLFGVGFLALGVLLPRPCRWLFGIGPDAVLAEIDAREEVTVEALAQGFRVSPGVIESLLERTVARGAFLGAWDRARGVVYSVDTVLTRENLQRCPHCGGAIEALGNLANCPYCSTDFAHLTGLDFPMPAPVGLAVIGAIDHLLSYFLAVMALVWGSILLHRGPDVVSLERAMLAWAVCGALPLALSAAYLWVGRHLEEGRRGAWFAQGVLLPLALPYLLRRRVRILFASGLEPLRARLLDGGRLEMKQLASLLRMPPRHADELAIYLTATGTLDSVLDWRTRSLVGREHLDTSGRERCQQCGAPLRLGGRCAFCATSASRAPRSPG